MVATVLFLLMKKKIIKKKKKKKKKKEGGGGGGQNDVWSTLGKINLQWLQIVYLCPKNPYERLIKEVTIGYRPSHLI